MIQCDPITYTVTITNTGDAVAKNVKFHDQLPPGLLWQGKHTEVRSEIGTLAPGQSKRIQLIAKAAKAGTYTNVAKVTANINCQDCHRFNDAEHRTGKKRLASFRPPPMNKKVCETCHTKVTHPAFVYKTHLTRMGCTRPSRTDIPKKEK